MAQTFSYCFNCEELCYGIPSNNGVYSKDNAATNHWQCLCHNFRDPEEYSPPVKMLLIKLGAGVPITDIEMQIAKIGLHLDDKVTPNYNGTWSAKELEAWREAWINRGRETRPMKQIRLTRQKPHPRFPNATTRLIWVYEDTGKPAQQHHEPEPALKISGTPTPTLPPVELTLF